MRSAGAADATCLGVAGWAGSALAAVVLWGCAGGAGDRARQGETGGTQVGGEVPPDGEARGEEGAGSPGRVEAGVILGLIDDAAAMAALEHGGLEFVQLWRRLERAQDGPLTPMQSTGLDVLAVDSGWRALLEIVKSDVEWSARDDPKAGVGMRHGHRLFDVGWLTSPAVRFELAGVVNRADRQPFADGQGCGETRLIYRLAYTVERKGTTVTSRLPMTINLVFRQASTSAADLDAQCREAITRWIAPQAPKASAPELAQDLVAQLVAPEGPLAAARLTRATLEAVELDVQTVRWPATIRPDLGGHAEYALRVLHWQDTGLVAAPLENTPDVERLGRDAELRRRLVAWLSEPEHRRGIDEGVLEIPAEFCATRAVSVAPHGPHRLANRPFSAALEGESLGELDDPSLRWSRRHGDYLLRLDSLSCQGCHQSASIAGFHLLGEARDGARIVDTLVSGASPHLIEDDRRRRAAYAKALTEGADALAGPRPPSFATRQGQWGALCRADGHQDGAVAPCDPGLTCLSGPGAALGSCVYRDAPAAGEPCHVGIHRPSADRRRDRIASRQARSCGAGVCNSTGVGFPDGMCATSCEDVDAEGRCGVIPTLTSFNNCLSTGATFEDCILRHGNPAGMRACDREHACREDYLCARSPFADGAGVCLPPYFLFQMRVDGHAL